MQLHEENVTNMSKVGRYFIFDLELSSAGQLTSLDLTDYE